MVNTHYVTYVPGIIGRLSPGTVCTASYYRYCTAVSSTVVLAEGAASAASTLTTDELPTVRLTMYRKPIKTRGGGGGSTRKGRETVGTMNEAA